MSSVFFCYKLVADYNYLLHYGCTDFAKFVRKNHLLAQEYIMNGDKIMATIVKNEVFIRGMLVGRYKGDNKTTAVICSRAANKEHPNYQYVTFFDEAKEIVDNMKMCEKVVVTAYAWIFRDQETKAVNTDNLRLRGVHIETSRDFMKRVFSAVAIPVYGIQMVDCVRFAFNGNIVSISKTKNGKVSMLLAVSDGNREGFNLIPLLYAGRGSEDDIQYVMDNYKKGQTVSVKGFVSQKTIEGEDEEKPKYKNTYFITSFQTSATDVDYDDFD